MADDGQPPGDGWGIAPNWTPPPGAKLTTPPPSAVTSAPASGDDGWAIAPNWKPPAPLNAAPPAPKGDGWSIAPNWKAPSGAKLPYDPNSQNTSIWDRITHIPENIASQPAYDPAKADPFDKTIDYVQGLFGAKPGDFQNRFNAAVNTGVSEVIKGAGSAAAAVDEGVTQGYARKAALGHSSATSERLAQEDAAYRAAHGGRTWGQDARTWANAAAAPFDTAAANFPAPSANNLPAQAGTLLGGVAPLIAAGAGAPVAMALQGANATAEDAAKKGAQDTEAANDAIVNNMFAQGILGSVPVGQILDKIPLPLRNAAIRYLARIGIHAAGGGALGAGMAVAGNAADQGFDPTKSLTADLGPQAATMAAFSGLHAIIPHSTKLTHDDVKAAQASAAYEAQSAGQQGPSAGQPPPPPPAGPGAPSPDGGAPTPASPLPATSALEDYEKQAPWTPVLPPEPAAKPQNAAPPAPPPAVIPDHGDGWTTAAPEHPTLGQAMGELARLEGGVNKDGSARVSPKGAIGEMQIMPDTAKAFMGPDFKVSTLYDPTVNREVGAKIVNHLLHQYGGDMNAVAIAYNAGPGRANEYENAGPGTALVAIPDKNAKGGVRYDSVPSPKDESFLPMETQRYLANRRRNVGQGLPVPASAPEIVDQDQAPVQKPAAPTPPDDYEAARIAEGASPEQMPGAIADVSEWMRPAPKPQSLFSAIRDLGGIKNRDAVTGKMEDVDDILNGYRRPGLINNRTGLAPDDMRAALQQRGWFGHQWQSDEGPPGNNPGDSVDDLYALMQKEASGKKVYHPDDDQAQAVERRAALDRDMEDAGVNTTDSRAQAAAKLAAYRGRGVADQALRDRATALGIENAALMPHDELLLTVLEHEEANRDGRPLDGEGLNGLEADHDERALHAGLTPEEHYRLLEYGLSPEDHEWLTQSNDVPVHEQEAFGGDENAGERPHALAQAPSADQGEGEGAQPDRGQATAAGGGAELGVPKTERVSLANGEAEQGILTGGERSARQAAAAREGALKPKVAQEKPGGLFGEAAPHEPSLFDREPEPREPHKTKGYGESNTLFTKSAAEEAREKIRRALSGQQFNSGIDPELLTAGVQLAGYHIEAGARSFADFARAMIADLGENARPYLRSWYEAVRHYPGFNADNMTPADQITPKAIEEAGRDVLGERQDLEQGGAGRAAADASGQGALPAGPSEAERGAGGAGDGAGGPGNQAQGGLGLSGDGAAPVGEGGAGGVRPQEPILSGDDSGGGERGGSGDAGDERIQPEPSRTENLDETAEQSAHVRPAAPEAEPEDASSNAPAVPRELDEALPLLFPEQRADVAFAEQRFEKPDGHGVMFTNGTGTGKTYSAGGIAKRFYDKGKKDILVVAPSQGILAHWQEAMDKLGVPFKILDSTSTNGGSGMVGTTYANMAANRTLADRNWNLVIPDESHTLMSQQDGNETAALRAFRAITNHPNRLSDKARMRLRDEVDKVEALRQKIPPNAQAGEAVDKWRAAAEDLNFKVAEMARDIAKEPRAKVAFMSATPFAYDKNIDYADKYLFDYGPEPRDGGYNGGSAKDRFFIQHFGYRMRYGKLTKPDSVVDSDIMERGFHEWLRREKVLSGRMLNVDKDYDRKFVLVDDGVGAKIDQALDFLQNADDGRFKNLGQVISARFDYLSRMRLLEAIKAEHAIPIIKAHIGLGRKVVVFHDYNEGGGFSPFEYSPEMEGEAARARGYRPGEGAQKLHAEFVARNPYVADIDEKFHTMEPPLRRLVQAFPDALTYNGTVSNKNRNNAKKLFNTDHSGNDLIIVQSAAGQAGISLHDTTGEHQRVLLNLGMPGRPTTAIQEEGRIYRIGQASDAIFRYMNTGTNWERYTFASRIAERAGTAENLALGDQARTLRESFINAFLDSAPYPPAIGEGKGGKAADRAAAKAATDWDKAKAYYFAQQKIAGRRDSREGKDYFATPEPLGYKMVQWADIRPGDHVLEPSAGHGAIGRWFPENSTRTLIEPSSTLASKAALNAAGAHVMNERFEDLHLVNKYDAIVMNPPFGHAGATAMEHLQKAAAHLREGGRIVALIPRGAMDDKFDRFMDSDAAKNLYQVGNVELPPVAFERAGTQVRSRVVILEKQSRPDLVETIRNKQRDYSDEAKINGLFDRIQDTEMAPRTAAAGERVTPDSAPARPPDRTAPPAQNLTFKKGQTIHGKTGQPVFVAAPNMRVERERYNELVSAAKDHGGFYSTFRGKGAIPGFQFKDAKSRDAFVDKVSGSAPDISLKREGPVFYSALERHIDKIPLKSASPDQWKATIDNAQGVKKEEVEWTGIKDWLSMFGQDKVPKDAVQAFLRDNGVQVEEKVLGPPDPDAIQQRAEELYRERVEDLADRLMEANDLDEEEAFNVARDRANREYGQFETQASEEQPQTQYEDWTLPGGKDYRELLLTLPKEANPPATHWDTPGVMAHVRFDTRKDAQGKKTLFVQEIQSDWHQKGRDQGYVSASTQADREEAKARLQQAHAAWYAARVDLLTAMRAFAKDDPAALRAASDAATGGGVGRASNTASWAEAAAQNNIRVLMDSTDPTAAAMAEHLASKIPDALITKDIASAKEALQRAELQQREAQIRSQSIGGIANAPFKSSWPALVMKRVIAWAAEHGHERIAWTTGDMQQERYGLGEKEGDGMRAFYDRNLVNITNDLIKRYGAKVGKTQIRPEGRAYVDRLHDQTRDPDPEISNDARRALERLRFEQPQHAFDITDKMREAAMGGLPLFRRDAEAASPRATPKELTTTKATPSSLLDETKAILSRLAPGAQQLPVGSLRYGGEAIEGAAIGRGLRTTILWALDNVKGNPIATVRHEAIHALVRMGLFTPKEWGALRARAISEDWMGRYDIANRYPDITPDGQLEEAIAERFSDWRAQDRKPAGLAPFVRALFDRLHTALQQIGAAARRILGANPTAEDVFNAIESGEIGNRPIGGAGSADTPSFARPRLASENDDPEAKPWANFVAKTLGKGADDLGAQVNAHIGKFFDLAPDARDIGESLRMALNPMAAGSERAQAAAKTFANALRAVHWEWGKIDVYLTKNFTPEQRERMWSAADEESVIRQRQQTPGPNEGLNRLTPAERAVVEDLQARADKTFAQAQQLKMTKAEALPSYVPRMVVEEAAGIVSRVKSKGPATSSKEGRNLSTTTGQLRHRKYETAEETEAAAQAAFGEGAKVVKDIRTLGLATSKLQEAIAGRLLIDKIKAAGADAGEPTVSSGKDGDPAYFTMDHPAMKEWGPRFETDPETGKTVPVTTADGRVIQEAKPLYVSKEFEGPLKAVLSRPDPKLWRAVMTLKGRMMAVTMFNPLIHNMVIFGKALPAMVQNDKLGVFTFKTYRDGNVVKNDDGLMRRAINAGLVPIGHRGSFQDITSIAQPDDIAPGRSWTAQLLAATLGAGSEERKLAIKRGVDVAGDWWHNKFLWDRVADLQAGLWKGMTDHYQAQGMDQAAADRTAAHFANLYAGSVPPEAMSQLARGLLNGILFSRSFHTTNIGGLKAVITGLPTDVQAQIKRDSPGFLDQAQGAARMKAASVATTDLLVAWASRLLAAGALAYVTGNAFQNPDQNEPGKKDRVLVGYDSSGTALYMRLPFGKYAEELTNWFSNPLTYAERIMWGPARFGIQYLGEAMAVAGHGTLGHHDMVYNPYDKSAAGLFSNMLKFAGNAAASFMPLDMAQELFDSFKGGQEGKDARAALAGNVTGFTISHGAPGGPAHGDIDRSRAEYEYRLAEARKGIEQALKEGDQAKATAQMDAVKMPAWQRSWMRKIAANPAARLSRSAMKDFMTYGSPEDKAQFEADVAAQRARLGEQRVSNPGP